MKRIKEYKVQKFHSLREMMELARFESGDKVAYKFRNGKDGVTEVTFGAFYDTMENLGAALCSLGYGASHVACVSENRYEWIVAYLTVLVSAGVFVPVDKELPDKGKNYIIDNSDSAVVFFSGKYEDYIKSNSEALGKVKLYIGFDLEEDECENVLSFSRLIEKGAELCKDDYDMLASDRSDLKLLVYTSGTTGIAKGVMLTEHNLVSLIYYGLQVSHMCDVGLSVLPYHHTYEAVCDILVSIHNRSTLCLCPSVKDVVRDMKFFRPSYILLVPAFVDHMHKMIIKKMKKEGKLEKFERAVRVSKKLRKAGIDTRKMLFGDIQAVFGGRMEKVVCGGAPMRPDVAEFFGDIGILVTNGYGITECSPLVSVNDDKTNDFGSAGFKIPCLEWRIDDPGEDGIGEICVKGDNVMKGYYKDPEKTAEAIIDGWFYTGDYGYIREDEQLIITGRKKNIIVLSNGKNVYPEEIEEYVSMVEDVSEVVVRALVSDHGDEVGLLAEVYLSDEARERGASEAEILRAIRAEQRSLPAYKQISKVIFRADPFEKTTTNKIIR